MFKFFKKKQKKDFDDNDFDAEFLIEIACILVHASKIDQNYTIKERDIIIKTLQDLGAVNTETILVAAEKIEEKSNQILYYTKKLKLIDDNKKKKIIESLWKIIYSDSQSDMYEANLMRRLTGLLYLDNKMVGDIKEKVKKKFTK